MASYHDKTDRVALKKIAVLLGLDKMTRADGSRAIVTPNIVVEKVAELVTELKRRKQPTAKKPKLDTYGPTPTETTCPPENATRYLEPKVNAVATSIYWGKDKDDVRHIPLNGGFHWDDRLRHALESARVNKNFAEKFSFNFQEIGLRGGEVFKINGVEYQVVGRQPTRPKYGLVVVRRTILSDRTRALVPNDLRLVEPKWVDTGDCRP